MISGHDRWNALLSALLHSSGQSVNDLRLIWRRYWVDVRMFVIDQSRGRDS